MTTVDPGLLKWPLSAIYELRQRPSGQLPALDGLRARVAVAVKVPDAVLLMLGADIGYDMGVARWSIKRSTEEWLEYRAQAESSSAEGAA